MATVKKYKPKKYNIINHSIASERNKEIALMLLSGASRTDIMNHCITNYNIKESSVCNYVKNAYKIIKENYNVDRESVVNQHINMYYDLYRDAKQIGDVKGAIAALNQIEKLLKLHTPDVGIQQNNYNILNVKELTTEELKNILYAQSTETHYITEGAS